MLDRAEQIELAARNLIAAIDRNLDTRPWPFKYAVPWKEATALRLILDTAPPPPFLGRIPPGPRS